MATVGSDCPDRGKHQYVSKEEAQRVAAYARSRNGWIMKAYLCPFCDLWHLTNRRGDNSKSRNRKSRQKRGR